MIQRFLERFRSDEGGAVLALVALSSVVLVGIAALAIDLGMLYTARSEAQRAADAAALAGASAFLEGDPLEKTELVDSAMARAYESVTFNRIRNAAIAIGEVDVNPIPDSSKVRVTITRQNIGLWFARALGITDAAVSARAAAEAAPANAVAPTKCIKPFAIPDAWEKKASSSQDKNSNKTWDFGPSPSCDKNCTPQEKWSWEDGDYYGDASTTDPRGPTGYGSQFRNGQRDYNGAPNGDGTGRDYIKDEGRRIPIKIQDVPSFFQLWAFNTGSAEEIYNGIRSCVNNALEIGMKVGKNGDETITTGQGQKTQKVFKGITDLIDHGDKRWDAEKKQWVDMNNGDPGAYWDEATGTVQGSDPKLGGWQNSARVITVALFDPSDMAPGKHEITFKDFALIFLEDPRANDNPYNDKQINQDFKKPITGRLLKFTPGTGGGGAGPGNLPKVLRLVE